MKKKPDRNQLMDDVIKYPHITKIMSIHECSKNSVRNWMAEYNIKSPKGFFSNGKPVGRKKGLKHTPESLAKMSEALRGEKNPFYGKKHSAEAKQRMRDNHADFTGDRNPFKNSLKDPEKRRLASERSRDRMKKYWQNLSEEDRQIKVQHLRSYDSRNKNHETGTYSSIKGSVVHYRSSWERIFLEKLDNSPLVYSFVYESQLIVHRNVFDDSKINFKPDFLVTFISGHTALIEIKPKALISSQWEKLMAQYEWALLEEHQYAILTEDHILHAGGIDDILSEMDKGEWYAPAFERCGLK